LGSSVDEGGRKVDRKEEEKEELLDFVRYTSQRKRGLFPLLGRCPPSDVSP
jgi:hypothetical protein